MRKMIVFAIILCLYSGKVYSQQVFRIQDLGPRAKEQWQTHFNLQPNLSGEYEFALLNNGVVTYSEETQTLSCVDFNGRKIWEIVADKPEIKSRITLTASSNGEFLYVYQISGEEQGISSIWDTQGNKLWEQDGDNGYYEISPSSKYMFTYYSTLNPKPLKILDIKTGTILWKLESVSYWQAAASENDRIVYYEDKGSSLKLFELSTGKLLWEKTVGIRENHYGYVHIANSGRTIVFQDKNNEKMERHTYVFDDEGALIWNMSKQRQLGQTNGGVVRAISDDGQFIAMSDLRDFKLFASEKPELVWVHNERMRPQYVQAFANGVIAFRPYNNRTRVFVLDPNGQIKQDYLFQQKIQFETPWQGKVLVIEPHNRLDLSLFELSLDAAN